MRVISEKTEYPNMLPCEIIKSGVALSGDALLEFMNASNDISSESDAETARSEAIEAIDEAIRCLECARDDL